MTLEKLNKIAFEHNLTLSYGTDEAHKGDKIIYVKTGSWQTDLDIETLKELFDPVKVKTMTTEDTVQFKLIIDQGEKSE